MLDVIRSTLAALDAYGGGSMLPVLAFASILYVWIMEDKREIKGILAWLSAGILTLFLCPLFAWAAMNLFLDGQIYYRILWLIPMSLVTAYACTRVVSHLDVRPKRAVVGVLLGIMIIQGGRLIYTNPLITPAENLHQLPRGVVSVCNVMHVEGQEVKAVVPEDMLQFVRQYDPSILLAYGREVLVEGWSDNPFFDAMEKEVVRTFNVTDMAKAQGVHYIVLHTGTMTGGTNPLHHYEFSFLTAVDGYDVYIFDRAPFAEEKLAEYESTRDPDRDWESYYIYND